MPRASETRNIRCTKCDKTLTLNEGIKCPRCKTINSFTNSFATELTADQWITCFLLRPDGHSASSICIRKEIRLNIGNRFPDIPKGQMQFAVFHVYNYLDPSKAHSRDSGCRVNPMDQPFTDLNKALALAEQFEAEALASGQWVKVGNLKL